MAQRTSGTRNHGILKPKTFTRAKMPRTPKAITCSSSPYGYEILVTRGTNIVDQYSAGNSAHDSIQVLPLTEPGCLNLREINRLARRTVHEMAGEHKVTHQHIEFQ